LQLTLIDCSANDRSLHYTNLINALLQIKDLAIRITWPQLDPLALVEGGVVSCPSNLNTCVGT
jgi:hypothetical protein